MTSPGIIYLWYKYHVSIKNCTIPPDLGTKPQYYYKKNKIKDVAWVMLLGVGDGERVVHRQQVVEGCVGRRWLQGGVGRRWLQGGVGRKW